MADVNIPDMLYDKLRDNGYSHGSTLGMMASLMGESGSNLDPTKEQITKYGKKGKGRGIAQWEIGGRFDTDKNNLVSFAKEKGKDWTDPEIQMDFIVHELKQDKYKDLNKELKDATPEEALKLFTEKYEVAGDPNYKNRTKHLDKLQKSYAANENDPFANITKKQPETSEEPKKAGLFDDILNGNPMSDEEFMAKQNQPGNSDQAGSNDFFGDIEGDGQASPQQSQNGLMQTVPKGEGGDFLEPIRQLTNLPFFPSFKGGPFTAPSGLGQTAGRVAPKLIEDTAHQVGDVLKEAPEQGIPTLEYMIKNPRKAGQDVKKLGADIMQQLLNAGANPKATLANFDLLDPENKESYKQQFKFGDRTAPGEYSEQSDYLRKVLGVAPALYPAGKITGGIALKGTGKTLGLVKPPSRAASAELAAAEKLKQHLEESHLEAKESHQKAEEASKEVHKEAQREIGSKSLEALENKIKNTKAQKGDVEEAISSAKKALDEATPIVPIEGEVESSLNRLNETKERHQNVVENETSRESTMSDVLKSKLDHSRRLGQGLKKGILAIKKKATDLYDEAYKNADSKKVDIGQQSKRSMDEIINEVVELHKEGGLDTKKGKALGQELEKTKESTVISGSNAIKMYKSINQYMQEATKKAYKVGINEVDRANLLDKAKKLGETKEKLKKILKDNIGDDFALIEKADDIWANDYAPLYGNRAFKTAMKSEKVGKNIIETLSGSDRGSTILKKIIQEDPELLSHAIGQHYNRSKPKSFYEKAETELLNEYIDKHPNIKSLVEQQKLNESTIKQETSNISKHEAEHKESIERATENNKQIKEYKDNKQKLESKIDKHQKSLKQINEKLSEYEQHVEKLKEAIKAEDISFAEKNKIGNELDRLKLKIKGLKVKKTETTGALFNLSHAIIKIAKSIAKGA